MNTETNQTVISNSFPLVCKNVPSLSVWGLSNRKRSMHDVRVGVYKRGNEDWDNELARASLIQNRCPGM